MVVLLAETGEVPQSPRPLQNLQLRVFLGLMIGKHVVLPCVALVIAILAGGAVGQVEFKAVGKEPEAGRYRVCRSLLVRPWKNQPEEYEGYNGFVGWSGIARLKSGRWLVTSTSPTCTPADIGPTTHALRPCGAYASESTTMPRASTFCPRPDPRPRKKQAAEANGGDPELGDKL